VTLAEKVFLDRGCQ